MSRAWRNFWKDTLFLVCLLLALGSAGGFEIGAFSLGRWLLYTAGFVLLAGCCLRPQNHTRRRAPAGKVISLHGKLPRRPSAA